MSNNRRVIAMLLLVLTPALAEEREDGDDAQPIELGAEEYLAVDAEHLPSSNTIATKLPVALQRTPANVGVVSDALLREQGSRVLSDALRNVSGLNIQTQAGVHDYFMIRGFNSVDGGLVLTDGAAEPEATYYGLYNIEGVEVLKGPGGFLYGKDPMAGAVNLVRKQPLPGNFAILSGSLGSYDTFQGSADWNVASDSGDLSFRLNAIWDESQHYRDDKDSRHWAANPSFTWRLGENSRLNFNLEYVDAEYSPDSGLPLYDGEIADVPRTRSYQSPFDFSNQSISRFQVDYETRIGERVRLRNKTYYRDLEWESAGTLIVGAADLGGGPLVFRSITALDDRQEYAGNQFEAIVEFRTGPVEHSLLTGIEVAQYTDDFDLGVDPFTPPIDLFDPQESASSVSALPFLAGDSTQDILAPYVIDQITFSEKVQLMLGARYDDIDTEVDYRVHPVPGVTEFNPDDSGLSPMAGLVVAPTESLSLYANAAEAFSPISVRVLEAPFLDDPEESRQIELGAKKQFLDGRLRTTFAVYRIDRDNIPIVDDNGFTQQAGDQRSEGFEFELAAELRPRLRAFFSYAYNDSELEHFMERVITGPDPQTDFVVLDRSGNTAAFAPEHLLNAWVSKSFRRLGLGGGLRWVDEQFIAEDNAFAIDGALILDATVFYDFEGCRLKLQLKNLTDEEYEVRGFGANSVIPADPFTAHVGFEWRL